MNSNDLYVGVDIGQLKPGDIITDDQLREIWTQNNKSKNSIYGLFLLRFRSDIENFAWNSGRPVICRMKRNDLHIMQGYDAGAYLRNRIESSFRQVARLTALMSVVETDDMNSNEREDFDRWTVEANEQLDAVIRVRRRLKISDGIVESMLQLRSRSVLPSLDD